jgi:hypothetical protein
MDWILKKCIKVYISIEIHMSHNIAMLLTPFSRIIHVYYVESLALLVMELILKFVQLAVLGFT